MKILKKVYYHINGTPGVTESEYAPTTNYIKGEVYYDEGGYSYFSYKQTPRAYFISAYKVGRGSLTESFSLYGNDGVKQLLFEVGRQSKKRSEEAISYFDENIDEFVKEHFSNLNLTKEEVA